MCVRKRESERERHTLYPSALCSKLRAVVAGVALAGRAGNFNTLDPKVRLSYLRSSELPWISRPDLLS